MNLQITFIIASAAIALYIAFLVLGFSLKDKNLKAQNIKDKEQKLWLDLYFCFFNSDRSVTSNKPKIIVYNPTKTPSILMTWIKSSGIKLNIFS